MIARDSKQQSPQQPSGAHKVPPQYESGRVAPLSESFFSPTQNKSYPSSTHSNHGPVTTQPLPRAVLGLEKTPSQNRVALSNTKCAHGRHVPTTQYGACGVITAVLCPPCGLICLFSNSKQKCDRCGVILSK